MPRTKKFDVELLKKYVSEGKSNGDIARLMGVGIGTVQSRVARNGLIGIRANKVKRKIEPGFNGDRHLCVTCRYRCNRGKGCDYILKTGKPRGCDAAECNVYEKGTIVNN